MHRQALILLCGYLVSDEVAPVIISPPKTKASIGISIGFAIVRVPQNMKLCRGATMEGPIYALYEEVMVLVGVLLPLSSHGNTVQDRFGITACHVQRR